MTRKRSKAEEWLMESLNELALLAHKGLNVPNHWPSSPVFWFNGLAREIGPEKLLNDAGLRSQLRLTTIRRLERLV